MMTTHVKNVLLMRSDTESFRNNDFCEFHIFALHALELSTGTKLDEAGSDGRPQIGPRTPSSGTILHLSSLRNFRTRARIDSSDNTKTRKLNVVMKY